MSDLTFTLPVLPEHDIHEVEGEVTFSLDEELVEQIRKARDLGPSLKPTEMRFRMAGEWPASDRMESSLQVPSCEELVLEFNPDGTVATLRAECIDDHTDVRVMSERALFRDIQLH